MSLKEIKDVRYRVQSIK